MNHDRADREADIPELTDELQSFAADLSRLRPREDRINRERLAFLAGQASVIAAPTTPIRMLGLALDSRLWPAAFGVMTAIAATLLGVLLARTELPGVRSTAHDTSFQTSTQFSGERLSTHTMLTAHDAHSADIETHLAKLDAEQGAVDTRMSTVKDFTRRTYTPTEWPQLINDTERAKPAVRKSSGPSPIRGANT